MNVNEKQIERGRDEGRVHLTIKGEKKTEEVGNVVMGKWKEGGERLNAFIRKEVTWERHVRMKILWSNPVLLILEN